MAVVSMVIIIVAGGAFAAKSGKKTDTSKAQAGKVVVTVNGTKITETQVEKLLQERLDAQLTRMNPSAQPTKPEDTEALKKQIKPQIIEMLVEKQLLLNKLDAEKIVVTNKEMDQQMQEIAQRNNMTTEQFREQLIDSGMTIDGFKEQMKMFLGMDKLMDQMLEKRGTTVTKADAKKVYDDTPQRFNSPEKVRASHILIKTDGLDAKAKADAKKEMGKLLAKVKSGEDFAELAKSHSACPSSADGGDLNFFERGRMVPEFSAAAFTMKIGDVSDIVETQFGFHLIKVTDRQEAEVKSFDDVKDDLKMELTNNKKRELWTEYHTTLRTDAKIVYAEGYGDKKTDK